MGFLRWALIGAIPLIIHEYVRHNDVSLTCQPPEALSHSPKRYTEDEALVVADRLARSPIDVSPHLPPRTGRRYIIVGGAGFLGGWMILHLLARGEEPKCIRIVDIRRPTRKDLTTGPASQVGFFAADICNADAVRAAFSAPWPEDDFGHTPEITVFHTVAAIRFYERHKSLVNHSIKVNVDGTKNVINAARSIGVTALVFTSSGSVAVRSTRFWLWPWEKQPYDFVQILNDDSHLPVHHEEFFSNYAVTKLIAERLVCQADNTASSNGQIIRTGCVRPANAIYGPGGDVFCEAYLVRRRNLNWFNKIVQSVIYVENCSIAHLAYEQRLIELSRSPTIYPDIGGQAFIVTDPGPPPAVSDIHQTLETLDGDTSFIHFSPTFVLFFAHAIEFLYVSRHELHASSNDFLRRLAYLLPPIGQDIICLQPAAFALVNVHLVFDDSRARLPPGEGGLGYAHAYTTMEGLCKTVSEYQRSRRVAYDRPMSVGVDVGVKESMGETTKMA